MTLDRYNQDGINGIIQSYADPPFHCSVHLVPDPAGRLFPIVVQFRTMAYLSLLGSAAGEVIRDLGIKATTRIAMGTIKKKISGAALKKINSVVSTRLLTKAGSTGVVNLTKVVPILGGLVSGGVNVLVTRQIGKTAISWLREGPPGADGTDDGDGPDEAGDEIIDGQAEEI